MYEITYSNSTIKMDQKDKIDATDYLLTGGFFTFTRFDGMAGGVINVFSIPAGDVSEIRLIED